MQCGALRGARRTGRICSDCGTVVVLAAERPIESGLWMRKPEQIAGFVNPQAWLMMRQHLNIGLGKTFYIG